MARYLKNLFSVGAIGASTYALTEALTNERASVTPDVAASVEAAQQNPSDSPSAGDTAATVATAVVDSSSATEEARKPIYGGVFLSAESRQMLSEKFDPLYADKFGHHMTVVYNPDEDLEDDLKEYCGKSVTMQVVGVAQDAHCHAVLVKPLDLPVQVENEFPHVTLAVNSSDENDQVYAPVYSNTLFARLKLMEVFSEKALLNDAGNQGTWDGKLPEYSPEGSDMVYAPTDASFTLLKEGIEVKGTFCLSNDWNEEKQECETPPECAFCRYMKNGPCGQQFRLWERCVEKSKDDSDDDSFVDKCSHLTLDLKLCIDENPEYYSLLTDGDDETADAEAAADAAADPTDSPTEESAADASPEDQSTKGQEQPADAGPAEEKEHATKEQVESATEQVESATEQEASTAEQKESATEQNESTAEKEQPTSVLEQQVELLDAPAPRLVVTPIATEN